MKSSWIYIALFILCACCTGKQSIFNATEKTFGDFEQEITLQAESIQFDSAVMASFGVHLVDSFLLFEHYAGPYFFSLYDLRTKRFIGKFLRQGRGPNEFTNLSYWDEYTQQNNDTWLYLSDINAKQIVKFNLSHYVRNGDTQIELLHQFEGGQLRHHIVNDSTFWAYIVDPGEEGLRVFHRKYIDSSAIQKDINLTIDLIGDWEEFNKLWGASRLRPDNKKMARSMLHMNRLLIFDLENPQNNITLSPEGYRDPSLIELVRLPPQQATIYYNDMKTTQEYIFVLFRDQFAVDWQKQPKKVEIHVFDWNGSPRFKLHVEEYLSCFCIDPSQKVMYAFDYEENMYQYDLSQVFN